MENVLPEGFSLNLDFLSESEEKHLLSALAGLPYGEVRMHGVVAKRRVAQFGIHYAFESFKVTPTKPQPADLDPIRERAAQLAGVAAEDLAETLVIEYPAGAGIGWHRDAPPFGIVIGISLGAPCRMRFQKGTGAEREVAAVVLPPRSLYILDGPARWKWQHTIPAVNELRYSITFRTLRQVSARSPH